MDAGSSRRFGIADGLLLIAGLAAGLGFIRTVSPNLTPGEVWDALVHPAEGWSLRYAFAISGDLGVLVAIPFFAAFTPACLILHVIPPRPTWRQLRRRPGFVACLVATGAIVTIAVATVLTTPSAWDTGTFFEDHVQSQLLGGAVAGTGSLCAWLTMCVCGVRRPRPTWMDRLGRLLGIAWIILGAISVGYILLD